MTGRIGTKSFPTRMELTIRNIKKTGMHSLNNMAMDGGGNGKRIKKHMYKE